MFDNLTAPDPTNDDLACRKLNAYQASDIYDMKFLPSFFPFPPYITSRPPDLQKRKGAPQEVTMAILSSSTHVQNMTLHSCIRSMNKI